MDIIQKYFPELRQDQIQRLRALLPLYKKWNNKINVISRKDIDHLHEKHVLHSLAIAKFLSDRQTCTKLAPDTKILDIGTGGGFPGIPLAIFFPYVHFLMIDSIEKKIGVVNNIITELDLENARAIRSRAENINEKFDFVVCRAIAKIDKLLMWTKNNYRKNQINAIPNGLLTLKGGNLEDELAGIKQHHQIQNIDAYFEEKFFKTKKIVYVQMI